MRQAVFGRSRWAVIGTIACILAGHSAVGATTPVITEYSAGNATGTEDVTTGPDGAIWFGGAGFAYVGRITTGTSPVATEYQLPSGSDWPFAITAGPDGAIWFTENANNQIGRITTDASHTITEFSAPSASNPFPGSPHGIARGPDGALWFTELYASNIGRIIPGATPTISEYTCTPVCSNLAITAGPDGAMWFVGFAGVGRSTTGTNPVITKVPVTPSGADLESIAAGSDGAMWFTEYDANKIGRVTTGSSPSLTEYTVPTAASSPERITLGPDGAMWFTEYAVGKIGRITTGATPTFTEYALPSSVSNPVGITAGPDGAIWFAERDFGGNRVGRITVPTEALSVSFSGGGNGQVTSDLSGISCTGSGPNCSFEFPDSKIVTLTASAKPGYVFQGWSGGGCSGTGTCAVTISADTSVAANFALGPDARMLSVVRSGNGTVSSDISGIACGTTCNSYYDRNTSVTLTAVAASGSSFTGWSGGGCSGISTCTVTLSQTTTVNASFVTDSTSDITLYSSLLPTSRSVQVGSPATFFGTVINASTDTAGANCTVTPATSIPASFSFQTTDPATNAATGTPNTPVNVPAGQFQSFLLSLTPNAPIAPTDVAFSFTCTNSAPAASNMGLNTLLLSASSTPTPDVVALAATVNRDGIVDIPGATGTGAFAVATVNVGSSGSITASANDGTANLPVTILVCQTTPATGQCMAAPSSSVQTTINANTTPTFAIFVRGNGSVPFSPGPNRIFVQFADNGGNVRGSTSVAVRTQ